ncbi:MAG: hypothetical protein KAR20_06285 [Candidatus Heimdallarchaeota archaeon]|nr:hypothetical protein [Candidatus Heimdallarchaeota archaeon]
MKTRKKAVWVLLTFTFITGITFSNSLFANAHAPNYVDIKYYDLDFTNDDNGFINDDLALLDNHLSIYITHGVSDSDIHYVNEVIVEFFDLPKLFLDEYNGTKFYDHEDQEFYPDGTLKSDRIEEEHVHDIEHLLTRSTNPALETIHVFYEGQETHQVFHLNITIEIPEWTYVVATAVCITGEEFNRSQSIISGHPWYDIEHSMIEAVVPTLICSVVVLTPLALWRIFGKKPEEVKH